MPPIVLCIGILTLTAKVKECTFLGRLKRVKTFLGIEQEEKLLLFMRIKGSA